MAALGRRRRREVGGESGSPPRAPMAAAGGEEGAGAEPGARGWLFVGVVPPERDAERVGREICQGTWGRARFKARLGGVERAVRRCSGERRLPLRRSSGGGETARKVKMEAAAGPCEAAPAWQPPPGCACRCVQVFGCFTAVCSQGGGRRKTEPFLYSSFFGLRCRGSDVSAFQVYL